MAFVLRPAISNVTGYGAISLNHSLAMGNCSLYKRPGHMTCILIYRIIHNSRDSSGRPRAARREKSLRQLSVGLVALSSTIDPNMSGLNYKPDVPQSRTLGPWVPDTVPDGC